MKLLKEKFLDNTKNRLIAIFLVVVLFVGTIPGIFIDNMVFASGVDVSNSSEILFDHSGYNFIVSTDDNTFPLQYNNETNTYNWPSDLSVASVTELSGRIMFSLADSRTEVVNDTYFTYELPELFKIQDVSSTPVIVNVSGTEYPLGNYRISDNVIFMEFQSELLGKEGINISNVTIPFIADIDKTKLGESADNRYPISDPNSDNVTYIEIPEAPTELSKITKKATLNDDNSVTWTISLGEEKDAGVSLAGATIKEELDGKQEISSAYIGDDEDDEIEFVRDLEDENLYTYTFPANSTLTAPTTLTVITNPKNSVVNQLNGVNNDVVLENTAYYIAYGHDESDALTSSDTATIKGTSLGKAGTVIDGNTIEWNLDINGNHANVYGATIVDPLSKGLLVDENYGITIIDKEKNGGTCTLNSSSKSGKVGSIDVSYDIEEEDGKQTIKVNMDRFNHEYDISFRTTVSNEFYKGDATVENTAYVDVSYPTGSGKGGGSSIEYGSPEVNMNFYNSHIKIEGISESDASSTGILNWKVTPSTKMEATDYLGGVMTLTIMEGQSFTGNDASSLKVYDKSSDDLITEGYTVSVTGNALTINYDSSIDLNDIYVVFDTRADTYFGDDSKHIYETKADLVLNTSTGDFNATQSSARQILQNSMVTKSVATSYDDDNKKALFIFKIKINNKGLPLTNVVLSDNLSGIFRYTDAENIDSKGNIISSDSDPGLDDEDYEIVSVTSDIGGIETYDDAKKSATVEYSNLNTSDTVTIELDLTNQGKEKLKLGGELSEKAVYAVNEATVKAYELDEDGITGSVKGLAGSQVASNKVAIKNGAQEKAEGNYTADIDWIVDINSMGASLGANPIIVDTIPNGLTLDKNSVKLYLAKHGDNGTTIVGTKGEAISMSSYSFSASKGRDGKTILRVNLPNSSEYANSSFRLQYTTSMSGGVNTYSNELDINVDGNTKDVTGTVVGKNISYGYGTIRSFLTMTKTDALSSSIKVKGAKYGVFETEADALTGDESKTVDVGYTDENGKYTFTVPGELHDISAKTYYVRELVAPITSDGNGGGYALDENVYTISGVTYGKHTIGPDGLDSVKAFTDEREKDSVSATGNVSITNTFIKDTIGGNASQFKLYVIPYGTEKKEVSLNKTGDGTYTFNKYASGTTIAGAPSVKDSDNSISDISINGLPWGTYKLVQTVPANGYIKASEISFVVSQTEYGCEVSGVTNVNNTKTKLTVTDDISSDYILSENGTDRTWELSGDELTSSVVLENELIQGKSYTLTQKTVASGYKKHDKISVNNFNGNQTVNITESPIVGNVIVKNQDGDVISDAVLSMKDNTDTTLSGSSIDLEKKVNVSESYEITGTLPAKYMPIDEEKVTLTVNDKGTGFSVSSTNNSVMSAAVSGTTVTITVQEIRSKVEITEVSEDNDNTIIYGGTYTLYNADNDSVVSGFDNITNVDGIDIDYLTSGNYYLKQNTAPNAYGIIDATKRYEFSVDNTTHNSVIPIKVKNHPLPGTINVTKITPDGSKSLEGAVYKLYTKDGDNYIEVATATTDESGEMTFDNLLWDTYYLKEIKAPKGYQLDTTIHGAWTINADTPDQTLNKTVSDSATSVRIKTQGINILDGSDEDMANVELIGNGLLSSDMTYEVTGIFADSGEEETKTFADEDNDGYIDVMNEFVVGNSYTFNQKSVESPYNKADEINVEITEEIGNGNTDIVVTNRMNRVAIKLTNADNEILSGGEFKLLDSDGNVVKDNLVSEGILSGGKLEILGLEPGTYKLVEKKAPVVGVFDEVYYALDDSGIEFELYADNTVKVISINKDAATLKDAGKADNDTEVNSLLGVSKSVKKADAAVITYVNVPTDLQFNVNVRYNEDCNKDFNAKTNMNGVTYGIYTDIGCDEADLVKEATSDDDGLVKVQGLKQDTYYIKMISSTGSNVVLDENVYEANVDLSSFEGLKYINGAYVVSKDLKLEVYRQDLILQKTDREDNSKLLPGSTYGLYRYSSISAKDITNGNSSRLLMGDNPEDDNWSLVSSAVTDDEGSIIFSGVDVGLVYMIKEIDSPSGYQISKDPIYVRFLRDDDGAIKLESIDDAKGTALVSENGNITWYEPRLKVAVKVVDENDNPVKGAALKLICPDTNMDVRKWTSDDKEELLSGVLQSGAKYTLVGTSVPEGYILPDNVTFIADSKPLAAGEEHTQIIKVVVRKAPAQDVDVKNTDSNDNSLESLRELDGKTGSNISSNGDSSNNNVKSDKSNSNTKSPKTGEKGILSYFMLQKSSF